MDRQSFGRSQSYSTMSKRPISLNLDCYNNFKGNMNVSPVNSNNFSRKHGITGRIDLDHFNSSDGEFDDLTTTSGSELLAHEAFMEAQRSSRRKQNIHNYHDTSDSEDEYVSAPRRRQRRPLEMIQEISPVLAETSDNDDHDLPPRMPLKLSKEWNPLQTSTMMSIHRQPNLIHHHYPRPKTNPRHSAFGTPSSYRSIDLDGDERIPSLFDNQRQPVNFGLYPMLAERCGITGILYLEMSILRNTLSVKIRNAVFFTNLWRNRNHQVNSYVKVTTKRDPKKPKKKHHDHEDYRFEAFKTKTVRKNNSPQYFQTFKFKISKSRNLEVNDYLSIAIYSINDSSTNPVSDCIGCMAFPLRRLFEKAGLYPDYGKRHKRTFQDGIDEATSVINGGYFLLPLEEGSRKHFGESKIRHKKFYDDIGAPSMSTSSSAMSNSPIKMMGETDWGMTTPSTANSRGQILTRFGGSKDIKFAKSLASSNCYQTSNDSGSSGIPKKRSSLTGAMVNGNDLSLSSPSTSSSNSSGQNGGNGIRDRYDFSTSHSSSSTSGINAYKRGAYKRFTLPSIMTTSDSNSEISEPISLDPVDHHYLYADDPPLNMAQLPPPMGRRQRRQIGSLDSGIPFTHEEEEYGEDEEELNDNENDGIRFKKIAHREVQQDVKKMGLKMGIHPAVRRVASFSSPPTKAEAAKAADRQREQRRGFLGKTLHYLRTKVDGTSSQSSLIPTKEEVISWQDKMENLLENKFGAVLFGEFLAKEYSKENLDFCLKCREYKKLFQNEKKNAKKIARLAKEIDDEFLCDHAPNEVNLEASVKAATRAAKNDVLKSDTFSLAQNKIEQLIANDKYQRFLKSPCYQELLQSVTLGSQSSVHSAVPEVPFTDSDGSTTPCQTANEDTPLASQYKTLRSASALETLGNIPTINE